MLLVLSLLGGPSAENTNRARGERSAGADRPDFSYRFSCGSGSAEQVGGGHGGEADLFRYGHGPSRLQDWIAAYERAWRAPGTSSLAELFAPGATYVNAPFQEPTRGLDAIAEMWERSGRPR